MTRVATYAAVVAALLCGAEGLATIPEKCQGDTPDTWAVVVDVECWNIYWEGVQKRTPSPVTGRAVAEEGSRMFIPAECIGSSMTVNLDCVRQWQQGTPSPAGGRALEEKEGSRVYSHPYELFRSAEESAHQEGSRDFIPPECIGDEPWMVDFQCVQQAGRAVAEEGSRMFVPAKCVGALGIDFECIQKWQNEGGRAETTEGSRSFIPAECVSPMGVDFECVKKSLGRRVTSRSEVEEGSRGFVPAECIGAWGVDFECFKRHAGRAVAEEGSRMFIPAKCVDGWAIDFECIQEWQQENGAKRAEATEGSRFFVPAECVDPQGGVIFACFQGMSRSEVEEGSRWEKPNGFLNSKCVDVHGNVNMVCVALTSAGPPKGTTWGHVRPTQGRAESDEESRFESGEGSRGFVPAECVDPQAPGMVNWDCLMAQGRAEAVEGSRWFVPAECVAPTGMVDFDCVQKAQGRRSVKTEGSRRFVPAECVTGGVDWDCLMTWAKGKLARSAISETAAPAGGEWVLPVLVVAMLSAVFLTVGLVARRRKTTRAETMDQMSLLA